MLFVSYVCGVIVFRPLNASEGVFFQPHESESVHAMHGENYCLLYEMIYLINTISSGHFFASLRKQTKERKLVT